MLINVVFFNKSLGVAGEPFFHLLLVLCFAWENSNLILLLSFPLFASFTTSPNGGAHRQQHTAVYARKRESR